MKPVLMVHRRLLVVAALVAAALMVDILGQPPARAAELEIFTDGYPRVFGFRRPEGDAVAHRLDASCTLDQDSPCYQAWKEKYAFYDGIEGKAFDETQPNREWARQYFLWFKETYPDKYVMLHFSGKARDPKLAGTENYDPSHWLYYPGSKATADIPAPTSPSELTTIPVEDASQYRIDIGLDEQDLEDIVIVALDQDGEPQWDHSEQVKLVSRSLAENTITVRRARYGSTGRAFTAGRAYLASHAYDGPWSDTAPLLWNYSFSADCRVHPVTLKRCTDILAEEVAGYLTGPLSTFDGVEFDIFNGTIPVAMATRGIDTDGDLLIDNGIDPQSGDNRFLLGQYSFAQELRSLLPDKLLMGDGQLPTHARSFDQFNGAEYEGWPLLEDSTIEQWSRGLNIANFWDQRGVEDPHRFSYFVHKYKTESTKNVTRLDLSIPQYMDYAANTYANYPKVSQDWDEMVEGAESVPNWLGFPAGPAVRVAKTAPDLLGNHGVLSDAVFVSWLSGAGMIFENAAPEGAVKVSSGDGSPINFRLNDVTTTASSGNPRDVVLFTTFRAEPLPNRPPGEGRKVDVKVFDANGQPLATMMSWTDGDDFEASFYLRGVESGSLSYLFTFEGANPVWISNTTHHASTDALYRQFDNGLVLSNPSDLPYTFDLSSVPGSYHRLLGQADQDPVHNNGSKVGSTLTLGPRDAIFLSKDEPFVDSAPPTFGDAGSLTISEVTPVDVLLNWTPATDDTKVVSYEIYRNGALLTTVSGVLDNYRVTGLAPETQYSFKVHAVDLADKRSSTFVSAPKKTPPADVVAPTWQPTLDVTKVRQTFAGISWMGASDNRRIARYAIFINGNTSPVANVAADVASYSLRDLVPGRQYTVTVQAIDNSGNMSTDGPAATFRAAYDRNPPLWSPIAELRATNVTPGGLTLSWDRAFDEAEILEYSVYQDGDIDPIVETERRTLDVTGLVSGSHTFYIEAIDTAGNRSKPGPSLEVTIP